MNDKGSKKISRCVIFTLVDLLNAIRLIIISRFKPCGKIKDDKINGKRIIIIGNGPSRNTVDLFKLKKKAELCCVNFFPSMDASFFDLKPEYYAAADPIIFGDYSNDVSAKKKVRELLDSLEQVDWPMRIITVKGNSFSIKNDFLSYDYLNPYYFRAFQMRGLQSYMYDLGFASSGRANVLSFALFYFVRKRASCVYLTGADMDMLWGCKLNKRNHVLYKDEHFYGTEYRDLTDDGKIKYMDFTSFLKASVAAFENFVEIKRYSDYSRVKIYNLSMDSYIDVFKKRKWEDI